jgi:hypothetical protein
MISLTKLTGAQTNIEYNYLDTDEILSYDVVGTYTFSIADLSLEEGGAMLEGVNALRKIFQREIVSGRLGSDVYTRGVVENISHQPEDLIGDTDVSITIREKRNSDSSSAIKDLVPYAKDLESFTEDYSFERSGNSYNYSRQVSLKYSNNLEKNLSDRAYFVIKNFYLSRRPNFGKQFDGISENARFSERFAPLLSERVDLINNSISFSENFQCNVVNGSHSEQISKTESILDSGHLETTFNGVIKGINHPKEYHALKGVQSTIERLFAENTQYGRPISVEKTIPKDGGIAQFSLTFTTDPTQNILNSTTYEVSRNKRGRFYDYEVSMEFKSGGINITDKDKRVHNLRNTKKTFGETKILGLFDNVGDIYEKSRNSSFSKINSTLSESVTYTNDPAYDSDSFEDGILKSLTTISQDNQVKRIFRFLSLKELEEMFVRGSLSTVGKYTITRQVTTKRSKGWSYGKEVLSAETLPTPANARLESDVYAIDIDRGVTTRTAQYLYY